MRQKASRRRTWSSRLCHASIWPRARSTLLWRTTATLAFSNLHSTWSSADKRSPELASNHWTCLKKDFKHTSLILNGVSSSWLRWTWGYHSVTARHQPGPCQQLVRNRCLEFGDQKKSLKESLCWTWRWKRRRRKSTGIKLWPYFCTKQTVEKPFMFSFF